MRDDYVIHAEYAALHHDSRNSLQHTPRTFGSTHTGTRMHATNATSRPALSFWQIWNMSFGFLGIQFGFALQGGFMSRIFQTLGAEKDALPLLWIAAPLTGLLVQPVIGWFSDRTWHPVLGRRRPYFVVGAILSSIALLFMPHSPTLWMAVGLLWVLDASINISMEPFRALVADKLPEQQRSYGFVLQTLIIGIGTWVASNLPWFVTLLGVSNEAGPGIVPPSVKIAFAIGAFVFMASILVTVFTTREYPPEDLQRFREENRAQGNLFSEIVQARGDDAACRCVGSARCSSSAGWRSSACGAWPRRV